MAPRSLRAVAARLVHHALLPVRIARGIATLALPAVLATGLLFLHNGGVGASQARDQRPALALSAGQPALDAVQSGATERLTTALAKDGSGISFTIVQRSTVRPRPDGKDLRVADPADPSKSVVVDEVPFGSLTELGTATADGFYAELREGPAPGKDPDWTIAPAFQALTRDGVVYRNEGKGWYETDNPPGVGLDPAVLARLGTLEVTSASAHEGFDMTSRSAAASARGSPGGTRSASAPERATLR